MKIGSIKEKNKNERRVSMTPASAIQIIKLGHECYIEENAGLAAGFSNQDYIDAGVKVINNAKNMCHEVDILVKVQPPTADEVSLLQKDKTLISFFYPGQSDTLLN